LSTPSQSTESPAAPRRVLVVDDNHAIHEDFRKILGASELASGDLDRAEAELFGGAPSRAGRALGFELTSAFQGEEAIQAVAAAVRKNHRFAIAFVDVRMPPGLDGIETTARLWELDPDLQVVLCTAYSDYSWEDMLIRLGLSDRLVILKKPFDTVEVLQMAGALTEKWRLLQTTRQRMEDLEVRIAQRTCHLAEANEKLGAEIARRIRREQCLSLQNEVARTLADSSANSDQMIRSILDLICSRMNWQLGRFWQVDSTANAIRCSCFRLTQQSAEGPAPANGSSVAPNWPSTLTSGCGLAGHVWKTGQPLWVTDGSSQMGELALPGEEPAGFHAGFAFPIRLESRVTAILEFRGKEAREEDTLLLNGLETVGSLIGHALERKQLEEQLRHTQKMEAVGHLAGGIAHDFNNILTVIRGYAELLKDHPGLPKPAADGLHQIWLASDRASLLTRQLLTFSRKQILQTKVLDLNQVVAQTEAMLRRVVREDITFHVQGSEEPAMILADEGMITQVLMNLACNARDAMPKGGVLSIRTRLLSLNETACQNNAEARPGDFVCLSVEDTGCGIRPEHLPHIFEPFFTTKDVGRGTGLGLCTVYGIVKQHGGWIEVKSREGHGTCFQLFFPRTAEQLPSSGQTDFVRRPAAAGGETILLVEDEEVVRSLARAILTNHGFRVLEAASGVQALALWEKHRERIDLLLSDIVMPEGISGSELAGRLRAANDGLPVLLVSGYAPGELQNRQAVSGARFLAKPYSPQKLVRAVRECLDERAWPVAESTRPELTSPR